MKLSSSSSTQSKIRKIERREWLLWASAIFVTLLLTAAIFSFIFPMLRLTSEGFDVSQLSIAMRGLAAMVLLFDLYTIYQQLQIYRIRRDLFQRDELFRLISENAVDMIAVVDAEGRRVYNSPGYQRILGYSPEDLQATSPLDQIHADDRTMVVEAAKAAREGGAGRRIEYRMRHKDGSWRLLESTASTIVNDKGTVDKLVIVNRDITERRQLEEQFRQSQKMEAVGRLSGGVAHDFNNLLGVMIGYAEFLQEQLDQKNPLRGSVDEILKAGKRAASLTSQLLAFSRQQVLNPHVLDLNIVVSDMEKLLRRLIGEDIDLTTVLIPGVASIKADQGQLEQVILNLAVNARDAMPHGGKLLIETQNVFMDEAFVRRYPYPVQLGQYICLKVSDTGVGMSAATKARAFEPFFTTKEKGKGTGLGLATVYGVVKQSGGYIDIDSTPGAGTTFRIHLPHLREPLLEERAPSAFTSSGNGSETILIAEDETALRTLTRNTLELCGYTVLDAKDGVHAMKIGQTRSDPIDLLLTDIVMPGMGGRELAEELIRERPGMKIVYMSGYTGQTVGSQGPIESGSFFLAKPFTREALIRKIREALDAPVAAKSS